MSHVTLETEYSHESSDLSDARLGKRVEFDCGSGGNVFVTPYAGEDAYDVLRRAHAACRDLGIDPAHVRLCPTSLGRESWTPTRKVRSR